MDQSKINISANNLYWFFKRFSDLIISFLLLPLLVFCTILIVCLNVFYNRGKIFFIQKRMGKNCKPFFAIKFRTMSNATIINRKHSDPVETERITSLGHYLRKVRLDELPQIINVIKGDMSLIGPRPDYYEHAVIFLNTIPEYRMRHVIRPGISGLAQIRLGYAEGIKATKNKSKIDLFYIDNACFYLDIKIFIATLLTIIRGFGK